MGGKKIFNRADRLLTPLGLGITVFVFLIIGYYLANEEPLTENQLCAINLANYEILKECLETDGCELTAKRIQSDESTQNRSEKSLP